MFNVTILGLPNASPSSVVGPLDVFAQSGVFWNRINGQQTNRLFNVELVTPDGTPLRCMNGVVMQPKRSMLEVDHTDVIIMSSIADFFGIADKLGEALEWVKSHYAKGTMLASVCTGAFFLAETGLLDGKKATTHWGFAGLFEKRYPKVKLQPEKLITDEGGLFCSGGVSSGIDLAYYLVEKIAGYQEAMHCAKAFAHDYIRSTQRPYAALVNHMNHGDDQIFAVQEFIDNNHTEDLTVKKLSEEAGMSQRTLERRFKQATGETPLAYLKKTRVEAAKALLESTSHSFAEITYMVGYEDSSSFRRTFVKEVGLLPKEYRENFRKAGV